MSAHICSALFLAFALSSAPAFLRPCEVETGADMTPFTKIAKEASTL